MVPSSIKLKKNSRCLELGYQEASGVVLYELPFEFLRVYSPSAEVRGHGVGNEKLQHGKKDVGILNIEPSGNYALKIIFDDGHDSGLYDWKYLYKLCQEQETMWKQYLVKLDEAGLARESNVIQFKSL